MGHVVLCVYFLHVSSSAPDVCKSLSDSFKLLCKTRGLERSILAQNSNKARGKTHQTTLNFIIIIILKKKKNTVVEAGASNPVCNNKDLGALPTRS